MYRAPPGDQAAHERWSLVYFQRPNNGVLLEALVNDSPMIADAVARSTMPDALMTGQTADAWLMRRVRARRANVSVRYGNSVVRLELADGGHRALRPGKRAWERSTPQCRGCERRRSVLVFCHAFGTHFAAVTNFGS